MLWLGNGLLAPEPLPLLRAGLDDLGRIVIAGTMIAFYLGAIGLMISSFTGRKSVAVGVIILGFVLSESLSFAMEASAINLNWRAGCSPSVRPARCDAGRPAVWRVRSRR